MISICEGADLTDLQEIPTPADPSKESTKDTTARMKHNEYVRTAHKNERDRAALYEASLRSLKDGLAGSLLKVMQSTAPSRLRALERAHGQPGSDGKMHDGVAMFQAIESLQLSPGPMQDRSSEWHEKQWEMLRDTRLPSHCCAQDFVDKVHQLREVHLPHFSSVDLTGAKLQVRRHPTGSAQLVVPIIVELSPMMCVPLLETAAENRTESLCAVGLIERRVHRCRRVVEP